MIKTLFLSIFLIFTSLAKKKNKSTPAISSSKRPDNIEPFLYCEACKAIVFISTL